MYVPAWDTLLRGVRGSISFFGITVNPIGEDGVEPSASMSRHLSTTPT